MGGDHVQNCKPCRSSSLRIFTGIVRTGRSRSPRLRLRLFDRWIRRTQLRRHAVLQIRHSLSRLFVLQLSGNLRVRLPTLVALFLRIYHETLLRLRSGWHAVVLRLFQSAILLVDRCGRVRLRLLRTWPSPLAQSPTSSPSLGSSSPLQSWTPFRASTLMQDCDCNAG